ncbi:MAG TPA: iron-containing alcohol dehydrogenase [Candidatus Limnocylindrales bacterium]|nr:iron-containing alcohol dehydrogenase [Candidatus Limnocylindrales bacterium]
MTDELPADRARRPLEAEPELLPLRASSLGRLPRIEFGSGRIASLPDHVAARGRRVLLVTGTRSFRATERWPWLLGELERRAIETVDLVVAGEPSPELVDGAVERFGPLEIDVVVGIGGGSVLDAAKAIAGLLRSGTRVLDHLEAVGRGIPYPGPATPFVAVPTTAGTGSEATRNAVLSVRGPDGFKRSFRDERLVAEVAIVDPDLLAGCPRELIASDGLDALTQLIESYVSTGAGPLTDAFALAGVEACRDGLRAWYRDPAGPRAPAARSRMAFAALASGIALAHAGLGAIHGLAAPLGAFFPIPHGTACGSVAARAIATNIAALEARAPGSEALVRYARLGRLLADAPHLPPDEARAALVRTVDELTAELRLPGLGAFGVGPGDVARVVGASRAGSMRTNPIELTDEELAGILRASL